MTGAARDTRPPVIAPLIAASGFAVFVLLSILIARDATHGFDLMMLEALRGGEPGLLTGPGWLPETARDLTALGGTPMLVVMAVIAGSWLILIRRPGAALFYTGALIGGSALSNSMKALIGRIRPDELYQAAPVLGHSFPSGHALLSTVGWVVLALLLMQTQQSRSARGFIMVMAAAIVLIVGLTRIYLGAHWATDVIAGWALGAAWTALCWMGWARLRRPPLTPPR